MVGFAIINPTIEFKCEKGRFIIDIAFTTGQHGYSLPLRITGMILAALLILYYYKDTLIKVFHKLTGKVTTKFRYKWWIFLLLPFVGFLLDFVIGILMWPIKMGLEKIFPLH